MPDDFRTGRSRWARRLPRVAALLGMLLAAWLAGRWAFDPLPGALWTRYLSSYMPAAFLDTNSGLVFRQTDTELHALDVASGRTVWTYPSVETADICTGRRGVTLWGRNELRGEEWHYPILGLDPATGRLRWQRQAGGFVRQVLAWESLAVAVCTDAITAVDMESGEQQWRVPIQPVPGGTGGPTYLTPADGFVYVADPTHLLKLDPADGRIEWRRAYGQAGNSRLRPVAKPMCRGTRLLVVCGSTREGQYWLFCHRTDDGRVLWREETVPPSRVSEGTLLWGRDSPADSPVVVVLGQDREELRAHSVADGQMAWETKAADIGSRGWDSVDQGPRLLVADDRNVSALSWSSGRVLWTYAGLEPMEREGWELVSTPRGVPWTYLARWRGIDVLARDRPVVLHRYRIRRGYDDIDWEHTLGPELTVFGWSNTPLGIMDERNEYFGHYWDLHLAVRYRPG